MKNWTLFARLHLVRLLKQMERTGGWKVFTEKIQLNGQSMLLTESWAPKPDYRYTGDGNGGVVKAVGEEGPTPKSESEQSEQSKPPRILRIVYTYCIPKSMM